jgi:hypothetical protein
MNENMLLNKYKISNEDIFLIDFDKSIVNLKSKDKIFNVGKELVYYIEI